MSQWKLFLWANLWEELKKGKDQNQNIIGDQRRLFMALVRLLGASYLG